MNWIRKNHFTLLLVAAVLLAFLVPSLGQKGGLLRSEVTSRWGVIIIFFVQGLSLPTKALTAGLLNWRLHVFVQLWNFLLAPALMALAILVARPFLSPEAWAGFWYLAVLPTTVSSAVAMTSVAKGDTAGAVFNTTLSNVLGVFLVPLWVVFLFHTGDAGGSAGGVDLGDLLWSLTKLILIPLLVGQVVRPFILQTRAFARIKPWFKTINNTIIVYIVYTTFCNSVAADSWSQFGALLIAKVLLAVVVYIVLMAALVWWTSGMIGLNRPARIAGFFCGSQKTLAAGVPMANAIFAGAAVSGIDLSLLILPLMCYHPLQLLLAGVLMPRFQESAE